MNDKDKVKSVKEKLIAYLENLVKGGEQYREQMVKQIETYENEVTNVKKALEEFDKQILNIKEFLNYVKGSK